MANSRPAIPKWPTLDESFTIPVVSAGSAELPPGDWAKKLWEVPWKVPWKVARRGEQLKGSLLPKCIGKSPVRELMARVGFFWSGRREEERIGDRLANVESAFIQCLGEVQDPACESCRKLLGP
jgi:hypothetical protein